MPKIIKVSLDKEERAFVKLYGKEIEITNLADKKGRVELNEFGKTYHFQIGKPMEGAKQEVAPEPVTKESQAKEETINEDQRNDK